ncbi:hypothetical protein HMPREF1981_00479 [Bacteroides pyogenes F0041]|uniref:Uncharacterized protein n=1 Tax=Bacteroides pyogenes F0041 TaxID=1321819 RepID=U2E7T2_9BACE|nr:hypothetical protein HMPREF1981_00479 [Bacteroides pyogenes F0041]
MKTRRHLGASIVSVRHSLHEVIVSNKRDLSASIVSVRSECIGIDLES